MIRGLIYLEVCLFVISFAQVQTEWVKRYGPANGSAGAKCVGVDAAGNIYITGWSIESSSTSRDYVTFKYNAQGNQIWKKVYNGPGNNNDEPFALYVDSAGNVYVTGESNGGFTTSQDIATIKYNTNGTELWVRRHTGTFNAGSDRGQAVIADELGNVYVAGFAKNTVTGLDYATIKYSPGGNELWVREYCCTDSIDSDVAVSIALDATGNILVTGYSDHLIGGGSSDEDYATIKYNPDGDTLWVRRYDTSSQDEAMVIRTDNLQNIYVTGIGFGSGTGWDFLTIKYDSLGNEQWIRWHDYQGASDVPRDMAIDQWNNIIITGEGNWNSAAVDYVTIKYDINGNECWARAYDDGGYDEAYGVAVDNYGNIYISGMGSSTPPYYDDYLTTAYTKDGDTIWTIYYDQGVGDYDRAYDVACSHGTDDTVYIYVTGQSNDPTSIFWQYCTIKYKYKAPLVGLNEKVILYPNAESNNLQVHPNPFSEKTEIRSMMHDAGYGIKNFSLKIYDISGRIVNDLTNNFESCIMYHESNLCWSGDDAHGRRLPAGIYFVHQEAGDYQQTEKVILLR
ncbi:MAG TPA: SBBP repeat-containing protein [bacterium]